MPRPFHLAYPCTDINRTRDFYCELLGASVGRATDTWVDLDFFGHQLVFHDCGGHTLAKYYNPVDSEQVPLPHFGVILTPDEFATLETRLEGRVEYVIAPTTRFAGTPGEQRTLFFLDPDGYALEFKCFADDRFIFAPFEKTPDA